ncbi:DUF6711 family protein [Caloramator sp. Dgby_cultured_2]|uniref:DUF6711 family protein n=1 Tax=Caloramator sp. Dgby_cultured_2 TaxID=3029174 RepID=UPI00237E7C4D|nr:DUF6711 family protein [Caloramator sp. Dgby_cultured_2]WDU82267.1 hypothetical protein PWK10_11210 [Caloramator sp. Dgby_cultured_2]
MTINGITIKTPTDLKVGVFRITKSERTASGKMMMEIIAVKRRLDLRWEIISDTDLQTILNVLESKVFHTVVYPDPQKGENATITAYVGDINMEAWQKIGNRYWREVSIALIEQ